MHLPGQPGETKATTHTERWEERETTLLIIQHQACKDLLCICVQHVNSVCVYAPEWASQHLSPISDDETLSYLTRQLPASFSTVGLSIHAAHWQFLYTHTHTRQQLPSSVFSTITTNHIDATGIRFFLGCKDFMPFFFKDNCTLTGAMQAGGSVLERRRGKDSQGSFDCWVWGPATWWQTGSGWDDPAAGGQTRSSSC